MNFKKYNSIENSYQEDFIYAIVNQGFGDMEYVVQEKVHGANFSFTTDGNEIKVAKRTGFLEAGEGFYNYPYAFNKYKGNVLAIFKKLSETKPIQTLTIFGELFGGSYPHPEVAKQKDMIQIQKGIFYAPFNDFYAFDIRINQEEYLPVETANRLFENFGFIYAKTLFKGSLKECLAYPNEFQTTLPKEFNLPEIEDNFCEGVVIEPVTPQFFHTGSRVIIKNKNERWAEKSHVKEKKTTGGLSDNLTESEKLMREKVSDFINDNRLNNVISKIGIVDLKRDMGRLIGLFSKDVLEDFLKEHGETYQALEKSEQKGLNKFINGKVRKVIKEHFMKGLS